MLGIVFKNVNVNSVNLNNNNDIVLSSPDTPDNNSSITNIVSNLQSETSFNARTLTIKGNFSNSNIFITNDCILISNSSFTCNNPINISNTNSIHSNITLLGDFTSFTGHINVDGNVKISTDTNTPTLNSNINISSGSQVALTGNFSNTQVTLSNNSSLNIDGIVKALASTTSSDNINLSLDNGAYISEPISSPISNINLSGDNTAIEKFKAANPTLSLTIISSSYTVDFSNGIGSISLPPINSPGSYKITVSIEDDEKEYTIVNPLSITIF